MIELLCLRCNVKSEIDPDDPPEGCPNCGDTDGTPADVTNDTVNVNITWHELRVLTMWAERWGAAISQDQEKDNAKIIYGIADRLQQQHMDKPGLTFRGELIDLQQAMAERGAKVTAVDEHGNDVMPPAITEDETDAGS